MMHRRGMAIGLASCLGLTAASGCATSSNPPAGGNPTQDASASDTPWQQEAGRVADSLLAEVLDATSDEIRSDTSTSAPGVDGAVAPDTVVPDAVVDTYESAPLNDAPADQGISGGCSNSLECVGMGKAAICDTAAGRCVECTRPLDCPPSNNCREHSCVPFATCKSSLECNGLICDTEQGRCVGCAHTVDCTDGKYCFEHTCHSTCQSDRQCTPLGMLCHLPLGICVSCYDHVHCPADHYCSVGTCLRDNCDADTARCQDRTTVARCDAAGENVASVPCAVDEICVQSGRDAACKKVLCEPGKLSCSADGNDVLECAADGLSRMPKASCSTSGLVCADGACVSKTCTPNEFSCAQNAVIQCAATGSGWSTRASCDPEQYCDAVSGSCKQRVCVPGRTSCMGTSIVTCDAKGVGYTNFVDCGPTRACVNATCTDAWFRDSFEGADTGWRAPEMTTTRSSVRPGANGTATALAISTYRSGIRKKGVFRTFEPALRPNVIGFWLKTGTGTPYVAFSAPSGSFPSIPDANTTLYVIAGPDSSPYPKSPFNVYVSSNGIKTWPYSDAEGWLRVQIQFTWSAATATVSATLRSSAGVDKALGTVTIPIPTPIVKDGIGRMDFFESQSETRFDEPYVTSYLDEVELLP